MDRAYRIGQQRPVITYKLITRGTLESRVIRTQDRKGLFDALIDGQSSTNPHVALFAGDAVPITEMHTEGDTSATTSSPRDCLARHADEYDFADTLGVSAARARRMLKGAARGCS